MGCCKSNTTSNSADETTATSILNDLVVLSIEATLSHQEICDYWTKEKKENAIPYPMPILTEADYKETQGATVGDAELVTMDSVLPLEYKESDVEPADFELTNGKMSPVPNTSKYPYTWVGQLHFVRDGIHYVGSATAFSDAAGKFNLLLTAAHNLYDNSKKIWSSKIHFTTHSGYNHAFIKAVVPSEYRALSHPVNQYDYGMIRIQTHKTIGGIGYRIGGSIRSPSTSPTILAVGYPGKFGSTMYRCQGTNNGPWPSSSSAGQFAMDSNMTPGVSGGPWITGTQFSNYHVMGINSGTIGSEMVSPVFTLDMWHKLIKFVNS